MMHSVTRTPADGNTALVETVFPVIEGMLPADGRPVVLDIGCGKGRSLRGRAKAYPHTWFIGIDLMMSRLQRLAKRAGREGLFNIHLWHGEALEALMFCLPPDAITECTIFFPDPWPKRRHHRRRLITTSFLNILYHKLIPGGRVYLATDDAGYYQWITQTFSRHPAFHSCAPLILPPEQQTDFEVLFNGKNRAIYRCGYRRKTVSSHKAS